MASSKRSPESLRTILERIDQRIDAQGGVLKEHSGHLERQGERVLGHGEVLGTHGAALEGLRVTVDSQTLLLEDMRSQNRATIEAVEATRLALELRIERLEHDTRSRDALLEVAVRELRVSVQQNSVDIRDLVGRVEALARLEERVAAIERRLA